MKRKLGVRMRLGFSACSAALAVASQVGAEERNFDGSQIQEIIVTAQKREQLLQEVPASITVVTRTEIERSAITTLQDYADRAPGLNAEQGDSELDYNITIRGIGDLGGTQNTFGLYLDGFELTAGSAEAVSADLSDIERIEVLRGPQGTTFGRNVIAGAINLTSIAPSTERISGSGELEYGSYGSKRVRGSINLPLVEGKAAMRIAASYRGSEGNIRNLGASGQRNSYDRSGIRVAFRLTPSERFAIDAAVAYQDLDQDRFNTVFDGHLIGSIPLLKELSDAGISLLPPGSLPAGPPPYPRQNDIVATNTPSFLQATTRLSTLRGQYDFDSFSLISVSGYVATRRNNQFDVDDSNYDLFKSQLSGVRSRFRSTELRAQSNGNGAFSWTVGGYASRAESGSRTDVTTGADTETVTFVPGLGPLLPNNILLIGGDFADTSESNALFAELGYKFTERLSLTVGARDNHDYTTGSQFNGVNLPAGLFDIPDETQKMSFDKVTWRSSLRFELTPDFGLYGAVSKGYRAGGVQLQSVVRPNFGPEQAYNYEVGAKTLFFDRHLMFNIAAFYTDWDDVQIQTFDFSTGESSTDNVGKVRIKGVDLDMDWRPLAGLQLITGLSYLDATIVDYINAAGGSFAGSPLPNTPEWSAHLTGDYQHALSGSMDGFVRATYVYVDRRLESVDDVTLREFLPSYSKVDLRLGLRGGNWTAEVFGENIFDKRYIAGLTTSGFSLSGSAITSPPRLYGVRLLMDF